MKLRVIYTMEKDVEVEIEISDPEIIEAFKEKGNITSDNDFTGRCDERWKAEQVAYDMYNIGNCTEGDECITNRSITVIE